MATYSALVQRGLRSAQPAATAVAIGTLYFVTDEDIIERSTGAAWESYSGSSGGSVTTDTQANRPAPGSAGNVFLPSNGLHLQLDTGAAWAAFGPVYPMTMPVDGDFAWINQGSATVDATQGPIILTDASPSGIQWRIRKKAAPATPYTITAAFQYRSTGFGAAAILFRQSSDGKLVPWSVWGSGGYEIANWNSPTSFSGSVVQGSGIAPTFGRGLIWLRIADNGTNRVFSISNDSLYWTPVASVARTTFMTADEVGYAVNCDNSGQLASMTLVSWKEA